MSRLIEVFKALPWINHTPVLCETPAEFKIMLKFTFVIVALSVASSISASTDPQSVTVSDKSCSYQFNVIPLLRNDLLLLMATQSTSITSTLLMVTSWKLSEFLAVRKVHLPKGKLWFSSNMVCYARQQTGLSWARENPSLICWLMQVRAIS